nr:MAG TPA: hypothetical protein [Caudoviricetes sp.]
MSSLYSEMYTLKLFILRYTLYIMDAWYFYTRFMHPVLVHD